MRTCAKRTGAKGGKRETKKLEFVPLGLLTMLGIVQGFLRCHIALTGVEPPTTR